VSRSTAHWRNHFIRLNGWLRHSLAQLITLLDIDGIGQNWEDSNTSRAGGVGHLDVATAGRHLGIVLAVGTPLQAAHPGQRHAPANYKPTTLPPSRLRVNRLDTSRAPVYSVVVISTTLPRPRRALAQRPPPAEGNAVTVSPRDGRGTADGGRRGQQVHKRRPAQQAQLGYSTRTPHGMGSRMSPRRAQSPGINTVWRSQRPAVRPPPVPPVPRRHKAPTPGGAYPMPARPLLPPGFPEAARYSRLALRPSSAFLGRSRPFAALAPSPCFTREFQGSPRSILQALAQDQCPHVPL